MVSSYLFSFQRSYKGLHSQVSFLVFLTQVARQPSFCLILVNSYNFYWTGGDVRRRRNKKNGAISLVDLS